MMSVELDRDDATDDPQARLTASMRQNGRAREVDGDALDMDVAFELIGVALGVVAKHLRTQHAPARESS